MNRQEFVELMLEVKRSRPKIFELEADNIPTVADIESVEKYFGVVFPKKYKEFVLQYGGGYFAFTVVYSFDKQSLFYIKDNVTKEFISNNKFFPVIDFETGDLAGFRINENICDDSMSIYNHENNRISDLNADFYEIMAKHGLGLE